MAHADATNEHITKMLLQDVKYKKFLKNQLHLDEKGQNQVAHLVDDRKAL